MRAMTLLLILALAGCGKPAPPPDWLLKDAPKPPEEKKPERPGSMARWEGMDIVLVSASRASGHRMLVGFGIANNAARRAEWPGFAVLSPEARDERGGTYGVSAADAIDSGRLTGVDVKIPAGGRHADVIRFPLPPEGCGFVTVTARMPDGKMLRWGFPESLIDRSVPR